MNSFFFWQRWLVVAGISMIVLGVAMSLFNGTALFQSINRPIDFVFWAGGDVPEAARNFQRWVYSVWGASIAGWGVFVTFIAHYPFKNRERWAWNCFVVGVILWYLFDSGLSLWWGVGVNAAFNTILLVGLGLPLAMTRKYFYGASD